MRVIKVLFLLVFFFVCMLFFVQNTAMLETPLVLKLGAFGLYGETPSVPFYVVLLLAFVAGGFFCTLYFLAEKVRLTATVRSLQNKMGAMEKQLAQIKATASATPPAYSAISTPSVTSSSSDDDNEEARAGA